MSRAAEDVKARRRPWPRSRGAWIALALVAATALAVAADPGGVARFALGFAYSGVLVDAERWQRWADDNRRFFGPLKHGARFALVEDVRDSTGLVFTRTPEGASVAKTHFLRWADVPVVLAVSPLVAAQIEALQMERDGDRFWDGFKYLARRRGLACYRFASREEMERLGLAQFLRNIDVFDPADAPRPH